MQAGNLEEKKKKAALWFYIYTFFLFAVAIGIAIAVDNVESVFNLVGAVASNSIGFLFPCLFYFYGVNRKGKEKKIWYFMAVGVFCTFIPLGLAAIIFQYV